MLAAVAVAATSIAVGAHAATPSGVELTEAGGAKFPARAFVVGLPSVRRALTPADVTVTENGQAVTDVSLTPAQAATKQTFGAVLLLDTSESMAGKPLASAFAAARAFAAQRNPNQQLAVVTFNGRTNLVLPFTTSRDKIDAALATPPAVAYGTHIYDAVAQAETMLSDAGIQSGSIVVLSDGADTGSAAKAADVASHARSAHVRLYAIGLRDAKFNGATLTSLAQQGGGEYAAAAAPGDLSALFDTLGARLSREYLLRYTSLAGPDAPVRVAVAVDGAGSATAAYRTPKLRVSVPTAYRESLTSRILGSWIAMLLVALLAAAGVAALVITLLQPRQSGLPRRMADFVSVPGLQRDTARDARSDPKKPSWVDRLDLRLEIARIHTSASTLVTATAAATALAILLLAVVLGSPWWGLLGLLVPVIVREYVDRRLKRVRNQFAEQLPDSLQIIAAALRSGHSFAGALAVVVERAQEPMRSEMQTVVADEQRGIPLETAIAVVVERMQNVDLEQVALVAQLQRDAGGNAAEVVDRVAETIRERFELRRLVRTLTVQGRMSRWIVTGLPVALIALLMLINPHYLHPLVSNLAGKVLIGFGVVLVISGSLLIKRIVEIEV